MGLTKQVVRGRCIGHPMRKGRFIAGTSHSHPPKLKLGAASPALGLSDILWFALFLVEGQVSSGEGSEKALWWVVIRWLCLLAKLEPFEIRIMGLDVSFHDSSILYCSSNWIPKRMHHVLAPHSSYPGMYLALGTWALDWIGRKWSRWKVRKQANAPDAAASRITLGPQNATTQCRSAKVDRSDE